MKIIKRKFRLAIIFFLIPFAALAGIQQTVGFGISTLGSVGVYMGYATANPLAIAGGLALGALGGAILVTADGSQPASIASAPITIQLDPNTPLITPTGWSSPTSPPSTTATTTAYSTPYTGSTKYSTAAAGCIAGGAAFASTSGCTGSQTFTSVGSNGACYFNVVADGICYGTTGSSTWFSASAATGCPSGYTLTSGTCNLTTATAVIKPVSNRQEIKRTGNTFSNDPQADPSDVYPASNVSVTSSTVTVNTADGGKLVVTINGDGSSTVTQTSPIPGSTNSKKSVTDFSAPDANNAPKVTGQSQSTVEGQGTQITPTAAATPPLDISSLNKEATQQAIKTDLDAIKAGQCGGPSQPKCILDEGDTNKDVPQSLADYKTALDDQKGKIDDEIGKETAPTDDPGTSANPLSSLPSGNCHPIQTTGWGVVPSLSLDPCPIADAITPMLDWFFKAMATIYIVLRFRAVISGVSE